MATKTYQVLEPSYSQTLSQDGRPLSFSTSNAVSLFTSTSFLWSAGIMICVVAAGFMYMRAGALRMQASEAGVRKSNEEIKRTTIGLIGVLSLFVILYTFNKGLLRGDVSLISLKASPYGGSSATVATGGTTAGAGAEDVSTGGSGGASASCASTQTIIASLSSGICKNTSCTALSGCSYQQYLPALQQASSRTGVNVNYLIALMCRESKANPAAQNRNPNGTYDCGLMQINQATPCDSSVLDPNTNISRGADLFKQKQNAVKEIYTNIPQIAGVFASYNCCSNGTIPNAPSVDCTQASGFPGSVPKWVCPINPGEGQFNMCAVKNYACDLTSCVDALNSM
jgi:hypothetical protein